MLAGVSCWMSCLVMIDIVMTTWRHPHVCPHQAHYKYSCEIVQISTICHPGSVLGGACAGVRSVWYPVARPGPATHQHLGDARISLYRYLARVCSSRLSSLFCPRISHLTRLRLRWILEYSRSVWAGHGPDAERWVTNGKQRENENMWGVQRLSVIILYPSLLTACWYNSVISVSILLHPWQNILYSHLI